MPSLFACVPVRGISAACHPPSGAPQSAYDTVALTPGRDSLVDLLAICTVNRAHAADLLRFERRVHALVPGGHGRSSRRRARRVGAAYAHSGPLH